MKKIVSLFAAIVMTVGIMSAVPLTVNAASKSSSEGVDVSVKTDTNTYTVDEEKQLTATEVQITVSAKNTSIYDVYDADVTIELPKGLSLKSGELNATDVDLTAGKSYKATVVAVKANTQSGNGTEEGEDDKPSDTPDTNKDTTDKDNPDSPKTGDDFDAGTFVALMIISGASVMLILKRYGLISKKAVSLVVCLIMVTSVMPMRAFAAESKSDKKTITVDETVTIDNQDYVIKATISFVHQISKGSEAESYFSQKAEIIRVIDAKQSDDVMTESEAIKFLSDRGFSMYPVTYEFSIDGQLIDEAEAKSNSNVKHPKYRTVYITNNDDIWSVFILNGSVVAYPVSFNMDSQLQAELIISETNTLTSYVGDINQFYVTKPKDSVEIVKTVDKIDSNTLDRLTTEVIKSL